MIVSKNCNTIMIREIEVCPPIGLRRWSKINGTYTHLLINSHQSLKTHVISVTYYMAIYLAVSNHTNLVNYLIAWHKP